MPGFLTRMGFGREATITAPAWPSAAPVEVPRLLPAYEEALDDRAGVVPITTRNTLGSATHVDTISRSLEVPFSLDARYEGLEVLWACALGYQAKRIGGTLNPEQLEVGAYRHRFEIDTRLHAEAWTYSDGFITGTELTYGQRKVRRMTIASYRSAVSVWEALSTMVSSLTIVGTPGRAVRLECNAVAHSMSNASAINTSTVLTSLSRALPPRVLWQQSTFRLAPYSTSTALGSGNIVRPESFRVQIDNRLSRSRGRRTGLFIEEPQKEGAAQIIGEMTFSRYTADTLILAQRAGTRYMMDWVLTGATIAGTSTAYRLALYFPSIVFAQAGSGSRGPGQLSLPLQFVAREPAVAAAGFPTTHHLGALVVEVVSGVSTHTLG